MLSINIYSFANKANIKDSIFFTISPSKINNALHIKLSFVAKVNDTKLYFPNRWASETKYLNCIKNLVVNYINQQSLIDDNKLLTDSLDNITYSYFSKNSKQVYNIEYDLIQDTIQDLKYNGKYVGQFRPIIQDNFFQINGYQFMILPESIFEDTTQNTAIKILFKNFPTKWNFAGSLICKNNVMNIPSNYSDYFQNIGIVGTTKKIFNCKINKCSLNIVNLNCKNQFIDSNIINKAKAVMSYQLNKVWKDSLLKNYTISLLQYQTIDDENSPSFYNGTGLNNMFLVALSSNGNIDDLDYLFNHELTHHWIGGIIDFEGENFAPNTWFSEGFTDYMTITNTYKYKLVTKEKFIKNINDVINEYYCSPIAEVPNDSITNNFWRDNNYNKLPYRRGFVFAMYLNYLMKENSNGKYNLSDFMSELFSWSVVNNGKKLNNKLFIDFVNKHTEKPIDDFFKQHIIDGNLIEIEEWDFKNFAFLYFQKTKCNGKIIEIPQFKEKASF